MKTFIITFIISLQLHAQFLDTDYTQASVWADPVAWSKEGGPQIGVEITKVMHWGWVSAGISHFEALTPNYTDAVGSGGINFNLFYYEPVRYYAGMRLGALWREDSFFPLVGGVIGFDWKIFKNLSAGFRGWIDYRDDQEAQWYGDYSAYKPGLITNNPLLQENGAFVITINW